MKNEISRKLAEIRRGAGFAGAQSASDKAGIRYTHYINVEAGRVKCSKHATKVLAEMFNVTEDEITAASIEDRIAYHEAQVKRLREIGGTSR